MNSPAARARWIMGATALATVAAATTACSSGGGGASAPTVTVTSPAPGTAPPSTPPPSSPATSAPAPSATSPAPVAGSLCTTAGLRVHVGNPNGAAGTIYYDVDFTNISGSVCVLQGYPGISLVTTGNSAGGSQIGADAKRTSSSVRAVTVATGQTAHAVLGVSEAGNIPVGKCNPVTAHWLKAFPPGMRAAAYVPFTTQTCASTSQPTMTITAISPGA